MGRQEEGQGGMKRDQEALMAAVARLEALTSGAEGGGDNAEGRRRR